MLWQPNDARDNSQGGITSNVFIDALKLDGTRLWRLDLGPNLRAGEHYNQFVVIDADGDGRAELGLKTAPGSIGEGCALASRGPFWAAQSHGAVCAIPRRGKCPASHASQAGLPLSAQAPGSQITPARARPSNRRTAPCSSRTCLSLMAVPAHACA